MILKLGMYWELKLPSLYKWWPWVDLDQFYGKVKFGLMLLYIKTMDFSETISFMIWN